MPKRLLVADDSVTIQRAVQLCLAHEDVEITSVRSAKEALLKARESRPELILADAVMPGHSGYDLCQALRRDPSLADVPVVLLASAEGLDEERAKQVGIDAILPKPFQSQALLEKVRALAGQRRPAAQPSTATPPPVRPEASVPPPVSPVQTVPGPVRTAAAAAPAFTPPPQQVTAPPPPRPAIARSAPAGATPSPAQRPVTAVPPARPGAPATRPPPVRTNAIQLSPAQQEAIVREVLTKVSRELVERIAWEVVPELAETIIREELDRLVKDRQSRG